MNKEEYRIVRVLGREIYEHRLIAERVLGRPLDRKIIVHHVDENGRNNSHGNLVICPSDDYHKLLHYRARALEESGSAENLKCEICGKWDSKNNMTTLRHKRTASGKRGSWYRTRSYHPQCNSQKSAAYHAKKKAFKALGYKSVIL